MGGIYVTYPCESKSDQEDVEESDSGRSYSRFPSLFSSACRDNGNAYSHPSAGEHEKLAPTEFVYHVKATERRDHHDWCLNCVKQ